MFSLWQRPGQQPENKPQTGFTPDADLDISVQIVRVVLKPEKKLATKVKQVPPIVPSYLDGHDWVVLEPAVDDTINPVIKIPKLPQKPPLAAEKSNLTSSELKGPVGKGSHISDLNKKLVLASTYQPKPHQVTNKIEKNSDLAASRRAVGEVLLARQLEISRAATQMAAEKPKPTNSEPKGPVGQSSPIPDLGKKLVLASTYQLKAHQATDKIDKNSDLAASRRVVGELLLARQLETSRAAIQRPTGKITDNAELNNASEELSKRLRK